MTECPMIRVQKDSLFRDGCSRILKYIDDVNIDEYNTIQYEREDDKSSFRNRKKFRQTKIGARNVGIYSLVDRITSDTVVITYHQI